MGIGDDIKFLEDFRNKVDKYLFLGFSPSKGDLLDNRAEREMNKALNDKSFAKLRQEINRMKPKVNDLLNKFQIATVALDRKIGFSHRLLDLITENNSPQDMGKHIFLEKLDEAIGHLEFLQKEGEKLTGFWALVHPEIINVSKKKFEDGHYADSVESAFKEINVRVKHFTKGKTGKELDGSALMEYTFSLATPIIELDDLSTQSGRDNQIGFMKIFAGSMTGIRNPKTHDNIIINPDRAMQFLILASLLMCKLDDAGVPSLESLKVR